MKKILFVIFLFVSNIMIGAAQLDRESKIEADLDQKSKKEKLEPEDYIGFELLNDARLKDLESIRDLKKVYKLEKVINYKLEDGLTPLMAACKLGHYDIVDELLTVQGIDLNCQDLYGNTSLMFACCYGHTRIVKALLLKRANVDLMNKLNQTALLFAAMNDKYIEIKLLKAKNANPNYKDIYGNTALMYACKNSNFAIVDELLKFRNIKTTLRNYLGASARDIAVNSPTPSLAIIWAL